MKYISQIFFLIPLLFFLPLVSAINATSGNYSIAMFGSGLQSSNISSATYNGTLLLIPTSGTRGANTSTYTVNVGFFDNVTYNRTVSISSYSISPSSAVVGSTIGISVTALNSQAVWANVTSPNNQVQRLTLVNGEVLSFLPIPSVVGTYTVVFYANSSTGAIASATDSFVLVASSSGSSSSGSSSGGGGGGTITTCTYNWDCTPWSLCSDGKQTRECKNIGTCIGTESKPIEEMSCSEALFDIIMKLKNVKLTKDESLIFNFDLIEQIGVEKIDVHLKYSIIDGKNNEIFSRIETRAVQGKLSIEQEIDEIKFVNGQYTLRIDVLYGNLQRAFAEQRFNVENGQLREITDQEQEREKVNLTIFLILLVLILAITIVVILIKKKRKKEHEAHRHGKNWLKHIFIGAAIVGGVTLFLKLFSKIEITGLAVNEIPGKINFNFLWALPLLALIVFLIIYRKKILSKYFSNKILDLMGKKVYTDSGDYIGTIEEVIIEKNKISNLKIKLNSKNKYKTKGIIIKYNQVKGVKHIIIIKNFEKDKIMT